MQFVVVEFYQWLRPRCDLSSGDSEVAEKKGSERGGKKGTGRMKRMKNWVTEREEKSTEGEESEWEREEGRNVSVINIKAIWLSLDSNRTKVKLSIDGGLFVQLAFG